jgi:hypothetical protein
MEQSPARTVVQIAVSDDRLKKIDQVAARLRAVGMEVDRVIRETGVIVGRVDPLRFDEVRRVPGVEAAERVGLVRIGLLGDGERPGR